MSNLVLIDYGSGNLRSVERALRAAGAQAVCVTADPDAIAAADRVVLPGQGAFGECMRGLGASGALEALCETALARARPLLGICVGMQLMMDEGLEHGRTPGLGWIAGVCRPLEVGPGLRSPHMGWNAAAPVRPHPVFDGLSPSSHAYFMHSYIVDPVAEDAVAARTTHGEAFACALARDNLAGVQFHPEKSQAIGLSLLSRFLAWKP